MRMLLHFRRFNNYKKAMVKPEDKDSKTKKSYWENIHQNKALTDSGWYQSIPESSLQLIAASKISEKASIIDVGGGAC